MDFIEKNKEAIISSLQQLIRVKTLLCPATENAPFGDDIDKGLCLALNMADKMGFETYYDDGYAGHIDFKGSGTDTLGVLVHIDVVPAADGWITPPYEANIIDGKLYGRGTLDNKGPLVACLYAMAALKDEGFVPSKTVRLIIGCDEESGWNCMTHYGKTVGFPQMGFSPDSEFPVINCEKGIYHALIKTDVPVCDGIELLSVDGGDRINVVPDTAECRISIDTDFLKIEQVKSILKNHDVKYQYSGAKQIELHIKAEGVAAHGSRPEHGVNALWKIVGVLAEFYQAFGQSNIFTWANSTLLDNDGNGLNMALTDEVSGFSTLNLGVLKSDGKTANISIDYRYPVTFKEEQIAEMLNKQLPKGASHSKVKCQKPLYVPESNQLVQTLMNVFTKNTGRKAECITMGGGTYARALPLAVAFGPRFPDQEDVVHQANEYISIENLLLITRIYKDAIKELSK